MAIEFWQTCLGKAENKFRLSINRAHSSDNKARFFWKATGHFV